MIEWLLRGAGRSLETAFETATRHVQVIAPYIKVEALRRLLAGMNSDVPVTVITRWSIRDIVAGASDLEVYDLMAGRPGSVLRLCPRLHAKLYVVDWTECFTGSANVSAAALGGEDRHNREIVAHLRPAPMPLLQYAAELARESVPATRALRDEYAALVAAQPRLPTDVSEPLVRPATEGRGSVASPYLLSSLLRTRNPDGLFRLYAGHETDVSSGSLEAAAHDLAVLEVPVGLDEAEFIAWIREHLLHHPFVQQFDEYLREPRYFGRMTDWLGRRCVDSSPDRVTLKASVQTLMRWLMWAYPGRYRLEVPRYSERFGRADGHWEEDG